MKQWEKVLQRSSAPLDGTAPPPSFTTPSLPPSFPPCTPFLSRPFSLRLLILCRRKIRIAREHNEDYQINIGDNLFLPSLLHGLSLHFPLLSACATHSLFVVNLCFHPLPFKSLTPSGYVREPRERERMEGRGGDGQISRRTCTNQEKTDAAEMRDYDPFHSDAIDFPSPTCTHSRNMQRC